MKQEGLIEPPGEPPGETLKKIAEEIENNPFLKSCLCLDGAELNAESPNRIISTTKRGETSIIEIKIDGEQVRLINEKRTIVCFRLRSS